MLYIYIRINTCKRICTDIYIYIYAHWHNDNQHDKNDNYDR